MPVATGSIAFLGAARFQGFWNANTNVATGSALDGAKFTATSIGSIEGLFETGSSAGGGYGAGGPGITASAGDYWQVSGSGTHNVDGQTNWSLNDWCIYSGSASGGGTWKRLAFQDTIASIIVGDLSASDKFNLTGSSDMHVSFIKGTDDVTVAVSGSENFTFDYNSNQLLLTGNLLIADNKKIYFGATNDASIEYDEDGTDELRFAGANATFEQGVTFDGDVGLGATSDDLISFFGKVTSNVEPRADNTYDLGSASLQWRDIYVNGIGYIDQLGTDADPTTAYISGGEIDNTTIGSETASLATFTTAIISASIVPDESGGANLGTTSLEWGNIYIADDKKIYFGNDSDASVEYDEDGTNQLRFAGAQAVFEQAVFFSDDIVIADDKKIYFGPSNDATIEYDEDGTDELRFGGTKPVTFENDVSFDSDVTLGNAITDATTVSSQLTASHGMLIPDDKKIYFGTGHDAHIEYDENLSDYLIVSGSDAGLALSGSIIGIDGELSGLLSGTVNFKIKMDGDSTGEFSDQTGNQFLYLVPAGNLRGPAINAVGAGNSGLGFATSGSSKARIFHEEEGSKYLVVSGSTEGLALSGSSVGVDGKLHLSVAAIAGPSPSADSFYVLDATDGEVKSTTINATLGEIIADDGGLARASSQLLISGSNIADGTVAVANDQIVFLDSDGSLKRETIADLASSMASSNGGLVASDGALLVSGSNIADDAIDPSGDELIFLTTGSIKRESVDDFVTAIAGPPGKGLRNAGDGTLELHFAEISAVSPLASADSVMILDNGSQTKRATVSTLGTYLAGTGLNSSSGVLSVAAADDEKIYFGTDNDAHIEYNEDGDDLLVISGSTAGMVLSGSTIDIGGLGNGLTITKINGKVGVNDLDPKVVFSATSNYQLVTFENQLSDGEGGGERLVYSPGANDTLTAGQIYFLHTDGTWDQADGSAMSTGGTQLIAVGFAGSSQQVGVLLRGFVRIPSTEILNVPGSGAVDGLPVYVSTTAGHFDFTPPSSSGEFVRAVGHAIDDDSGDVLVYFNPEPIGSQIP